MRIAIVTCVAVIALITVFRKLRSRKRSNGSLEPPIILPKIPLFGHAIGMIRDKKDFYKRLRNKCGLPIVTLPLPGSRVYVVFSVPTIQSVQKQHKTLAFQPIQAKFSTKLCGTSKEAYRILEKDMDPENGQYGNIYVAMHRALNPGEILDELNRVTIDRVCEFVDRIQPNSGQSTELGLVEWLRHHVTLATTDAVYGPHNPFRDAKVESAFWQFEREIPKLLFLPDWLARHGARNRQFVADAFKSFFSKNHHDQASDLVKDFYASETAYGFSLSDRSFFEVGHALAILGNTSGAMFWLIFYVFSTPSALLEIRQEVYSILSTSIDAAGTKKHHIDMTRITANCPTLVSAFREAIRLHSIGISLRQVCKDTTLSETYHLRKGAMILMPTDAIHTDPSVWGDDVLAFNHRRFHPANPNKPSPAAFRSFGGGTTLCPGRHFATTQVMAWTVMLVTRFDVEPVRENGEKGQWVRPTTEKTNLANVMSQPDYDIRVKVRARAEYSDGSWSVMAAGSKAMFGVTVEDLEDREEEKEKS